MDEIQLSVIVPVYNAELYLGRCLHSLCANNNGVTAEFIIIDDGSTDRSSKIIQQFAISDSRIKPFRIDNSGVAIARNIGIQNAKGKYITFLDADDYFDEAKAWKIIGSIIDMLDNKEYDLAVSSYYMLASKSCCEIEIGLNQTPRIEDVVTHTVTTSKLNAVWSKVYRRDLIINNNIFFPDSVPIGEDYSFVLDYLRVTRNVLCVRMPFLCYVVNDNSVMHSSSIAKSLRGIEVCKKKALEYVIDCNLENLVPQINNFYFRTITALLNSCVLKIDGEKIFQEIVENEICKDILSDVDLNLLPLRRKIELILINDTRKTRVYYFKIRSMIQNWSIPVIHKSRQ